MHSHPIPGAPSRPDAVFGIEDAVYTQLQNNVILTLDVFRLRYLSWCLDILEMWDSVYEGWSYLVQSLSDNMTPSGIGKSVIQTECHINQWFLV